MTRNSTVRVRRVAVMVALTTTFVSVAFTGEGHAGASDCTTAKAGRGCSFGPSSGLVELTVPKGIIALEVTAAGGAGGASFGSTGGHGALIHNAALPVTAGDVLWIRVGWSGSDAGQDRGRGGTGGALDKGSGGAGGASGGAGGGGATEIVDHTTGQSLLIAGGGGGAGGDGSGRGMPMFGGPGGDAGAGGGDGYGSHSGEGGTAPSDGAKVAESGPAGHTGGTNGAGGGGAGGGAGVGGAATGATDALSSGGGGAGGGSLGAGTAPGDTSMSNDREGSLSLRFRSTPATPAPTRAADPASDGQSTFTDGGSSGS